MIKKMIELFKKLFRERKTVPNIQPTMTDKAIKRSVSEVNKEKNLLLELQDFLFHTYLFRYNVLTEQTEYCRKGVVGEKVYLPVDQRALNTFCIDARICGINCWDKDVSRLLNSQKISDYHPFLTYMNTLPEWDGVDRVTELAERVSHAPVWVSGFHRWLLGVAAQWKGRMGRCANAVAPLLISPEQGKCKSTYCSLLMPDELTPYYIDKFDLSAGSGCEQKLSLFGLINMDEFDRYAPTLIATLKNLMQMKQLTFRRAHRVQFSHLPRIASFIGTSNQKDLLTDLTGSRRFLCVEVEGEIDCTPLNHEQLFAQLKTELSNGERYWFTHEEEQALQEHNKEFYRQTPEQDVFFRCFRLPVAEEECVCLSAAEIFCNLQHRYPAAMRGVDPNRFAKVLVALGVQRVHTRLGNMYRVVSLAM